MSRKKRRQEEERAQQAQQMNYNQNPNVLYGPMGGVYPVAPPANFIQLPPIVQPMVVVPFSSQMQPMVSAVNDDDDDDEDWDY